MKNPTLFIFKGTLLFFLFGIIFFTSCEPATSVTAPVAEELEEVGQMSPAPSKEAVRQFFYAWMADCANDHYYYQYHKKNAEQNALKKLRGIAESRIDSALSDSAISGALGQATRVWGPAIEVTFEPDTSLGYYYVIKNMLYCTHSEVNGVNHYSIGIAGTNAISQYDWLKEDINPTTTTDTTLTGGKISQGSETGLNVLKALTDSTTQQTLLAFLQQKIKEDPTAVISVSGHSLGGALTQVYSSYLKKQLGATVNVEAWVYAGPTAGDETFATNLIDKLGADNYHAYNNALDVVPHAWQVDSLNKVCTIYQEQSYCKWGMEENALVNVIVEYLKLRSNGANYTVPVGQNHTFDSAIAPLNLEECADFFSGSVASLKISLNSNLLDLSYLCAVNEAERETINLQLLMFLAKMTTEHTTGYTNFFFQAQDSNFKAAVTRYTASSSSDEVENAEEGLDILNDFLSDVYQTMVSKSPKCECGQTNN